MAGSLSFYAAIDSLFWLPMTKRTLTVVAFSCAVAFSVVAAADNNPPSEASIKQILELGQAHKLIDSMIAQMDSYMKQAVAQATQGQHITPEIQKHIERRQLK